MRNFRRFIIILVAAIFVSLTTKVWAATAESLAPPVIQPLSSETPKPASTSPWKARGSISSSREGRLATMAALIVFAFLIAGLTSGKTERRD